MTAPAPLLPAVLAEALAVTHSPSDALAYSLDGLLLQHPEVCSTDADYAWWTPSMGCVAAPRRCTCGNGAYLQMYDYTVPCKPDCELRRAVAW